MNWDTFTHDERKIINETIMGDRDQQKAIIELLSDAMHTSPRRLFLAIIALHDAELVIEPRLIVEGAPD